MIRRQSFPERNGHPQYLFRLVRVIDLAHQFLLGSASPNYGHFGLGKILLKQTPREKDDK